MLIEAWNVDEKEYPTRGAFEDKAKFLLRYAILAPSGHNSQPWKFEISKNKIIVRPDYNRGRSVVDSEHRELFISLGAVSKIIAIAADRFGMSYRRKVIKDRVEFIFGEEKTVKKNLELFKAITKRRTYRERYKKKKIPLRLVAKIKKITSKGQSMVAVNDPDLIKVMADLIERADCVWYKSRSLIRELEEWMRDDLELTKDGLPTGMINMYKIAAETKYLFSKDSRVAKEKAERDRVIAKNTPLFLIIVSNDNDIHSWIEAGEMYGEIILTAQKLGLASGVLGSITELTGMKNKMTKLFSIEGHVQLVLSVGYARVKVPATPRRPLEEMLA
ncbi:nitroreductase family protein [Candidatus Shapirobacteria bacterium]|nr:nitroreductase family protein [Candidatus Shapirobacteria bacterium]